MKKIEIFSVCIAAILTAIITFKWNEIDIIGRTALIVAIVAAILVAYNSLKENKKNKLLERINAKFGEIEDLKGATIPTLQMGSSPTAGKFILGLSGVFNYSPVGPIIQLYIKDERLFVNTVIRDLDGKPIAIIDGNVWTLYNDNYEYNNDKTAFELVTIGDRKVYFQIELRQGTAHILGNLINEKSKGFLFFTKPNVVGSFLYVIDAKKDREDYEKIFNTEIYIPPLFLYPRGKFYSVRANH